MPGRFLIAAIALGAVVPALPGVAQGAAALAAERRLARDRAVPGDAFLCNEARAARGARSAPPLPTFHPRVGVSVIDRFTRPVPSERYTLDLKKPEAFCWPVRIDAEDLTDPLHGLEVYEARRTRRKPASPPLPAVTEEITSALGVLALRVGGVEALGVPTLATGSVGGATTERDHFSCYQVKPERGAGLARRVIDVAARTVDAVRMVELRKPVRLCVPASVRGDDPGAPKHPIDLLCFDARVVRTDGAAASSGDDLLATRNDFGNEVLKLATARLLCVPAARTDVAVPTPTPFPTLTPPPTPSPTATPVRTPRPPAVHVAPPAVTALARDRVCFSAVLELPDGSTVDVSASALWRVANQNVAVPAGIVDGQKCFVGVGIGTTDLTAQDAGTGATSAPARFSSEWPVVKLAASPSQIGLRSGESATVTVTATLSGGRMRNVTQHVRYASGDETIARAPNDDGTRSRIDGVGAGQTSVLVSDTLSSLTATVAVAVGDLQSVVVDEPQPLFPGDATSLQTTGIFSGGFSANLTQIATYESSDPGVVVAANAPGDRSRIQAVHPGTAVVTAIDPLSGIRSACCGNVAVLGAALDIEVTPPLLTYRIDVGGDLLAFKAIGTFAIPPDDQATLPVTKRVTWSASPPGVVTLGTIGADGRQHALAVGGGEAAVTATDPTSGAAGSATVVVYDHLDRIEVGTSWVDPSELQERTIPIGATTTYVAHGYFDGGRHLVLSEPVFAASDPTVVSFVDGYAYAARPGTVVVSAVDQPSGLSSYESGGRNAILHVVGDIVRIELSPPIETFDIGQSRTLTASGFDDIGSRRLITQRLEYASSDPSVVVAPNEPGNRSRIVAVGVGTATVSATDPLTGITTTTTGNDVLVTVRDQRVVRVVVSPATRRVPASATSRFTATAYLASGETSNITQRVAWMSAEPAVGAATNLEGDRSRIDALTPGTTTISVFDPVSSIGSTGADSATLTVAALDALSLGPTTLELAVGSAYSLTTVGLVTGGDPINVTQDAVYTSSDPTIVRATNQAGNKSRIEAVAPGIATITASRPSAYPQATDSNAITVTVLPGS